MSVLVGNRKLIGVCLTKVHDDFRTDFLANFYKAASAENYKLIVFNSVTDMYKGDGYDEGAKSVFNLINYDMLDALVILYEAFYDVALRKEMIRAAQAKNVPVVLVHGSEEGCYCVISDYESTYEDLIRHVIRDHGAKDTFFMAGLKGEPASELRLGCYKRVLAENGIEFRDSMVDYGNYWDVPTEMAIERLTEGGKRPPRAIICANDTMAITVCDKLESMGYRIPEDVIVTGFDGTETAAYHTPKISTCKEDIPALARMCADIVRGALCEGLECGTFIERYINCPSESCGCPDNDKLDYRKSAERLYHRLCGMEWHEQHIFTWVDHILESTDFNRLSTVMGKYVLPNSYVCLNNNFVAAVLNGTELKSEQSFSNELIILSSKRTDYTDGGQSSIKRSDMVPELEQWAQDDTICIINSIYAERTVCGYYAIKTTDVRESGHRLNRISRTMNIAFSALASRMSQKQLAVKMENAVYTDPITKLPNLKGLGKWFKEFSAEKKNHEKTIAVSIYGLPQYKYIFENFGIQDIEEALVFVGDLLKLANPENAIVAHTSEDEFVVLNYGDSGKSIGDAINNSTSVFYSVLEQFNSGQEKNYYIEVNCGCTVAYPGWDGPITGFIKLASGEMYLNRLRAGAGPVLKEKRIASDFYKDFKLLIERNLFTYMFQPIIDARTGDIYAYEALMRSSGGIKMNPLEILETAQEYKMLYDVERATFFNVLEQFSTHFESFGGKRIFINTIPGNFLNSLDYTALTSKYGDYLKYCVIEITEQNAVSDEELNAIKGLGGENSGCQLAVDDYGTGHSNIVNLIRYSPQIIKIDRFLITDIDKDTNKQMFVKSAIEFARMNDIKVVAEGIETKEELQTVIGFGVDLIQGFYTAKPAPEPLPALPETLRNEIIMASSAVSV